MNKALMYAKFGAAALTAVVATLSTTPEGTDWKVTAITAAGAVLVLLVPNKGKSA